jgi:hypothetical protein
MVAQKALFHPVCLLRLYKKAEKEVSCNVNSNPDINHLHFDEDKPESEFHQTSAQFDQCLDVLSSASKLIRMEILNIPQSFDGSFREDAEAASVPACLINFIAMIINGSQDNISQAVKTISTSIAQIISFNCVERRCDSSGSVRHPRERETPQAILLAMKAYLHSDKQLVDMMAKRGLCISYGRLRQLNMDLANSTIATWDKEGVVFPTKATKGAFTTCGVDNIDYNATSTTASPDTMLHGTAISVLQHFPGKNLPPAPTQSLIEEEMGKPFVRPLPTSYTTMEEVALPKEDVNVPALPNLNSHPVIAARPVDDLVKEERDWLERVESKLHKELSREDFISWGAYHATDGEPILFKTQSHMLPIFTSVAHSPTTMMHCMLRIVEITNHLNPGQPPVMVVDQPLYALAKRLQWQFPDSPIGEDRFFVFLGAMHIEKMLWTCAGEWLEGSGWATMIANAGVTTHGSAQSMLKATHICRTRYMSMKSRLQSCSCWPRKHTRQRVIQTSLSRLGSRDASQVSPNRSTGGKHWSLS